MNFDLSDDAKTLREAARKFLDAKAGPAVARQVMDAGASMNAGLWAEVVEQGWPAVRVPEDQGGLGLGAEEACVLAEEAGRSLAPVPLVSTLAAIEALLVAGSEAQQAEWLPRLASGEAIGCIAWAEGAKSPLQQPDTRLEGGRLRGAKSPVIDGRVATMAIVTVAGPDGPVMAIADLATAGRSDVASLDLVRPSASLKFDGVAADALGTAADWVKVTQRIAMLTAWEALGTAEAAREMTVDYARERVAFGQRIGRYQGVKHKLADMYIKAELARAHALYGCWAWSADSDELEQAAAAARVAALDAVRFAGEEGLHLHGGIGFTWEQDCQFYYRRNRLLATFIGTRGHWSDRLVRTLEQRNKAA